MGVSGFLSAYIYSYGGYVAIYLIAIALVVLGRFIYLFTFSWLEYIGGYIQYWSVLKYGYIFESQRSCDMLINSKLVWFKYCGLRFDKFIGTWLIWILLKNNYRLWDSFFNWIISQLSSYWTVYFQETKDRRIE